jgi:hypothetical protein
MTGEATNSAPAESDSAHLATDIDTLAKLDFDDPGEEEQQDNEEAETSGTDDNSETGEGEEAQETAETDTTDEAASDETEESGKDQPSGVKDDVIVDVQGEKLPLSELRSGYMRDRDYRHKTQAIANQRRDLEGLTQRVTDSVNAIADLLVAQAPKAPDPSLAMTDPGRYVQEKALHDAAMANINAIIEKANAPKEVANTLTQEQRAEQLRSEDAKLREAFPQTKDPKGREKFFNDAMSAAVELGYSADEIKGVSDHRLFALAHYARLGLAAEKAKAKATQKVANVPPMAQQKRQSPVNAKAKANQDAMRKLAKTGSMADAMAIDFD